MAAAKQALRKHMKQVLSTITGDLRLEKSRAIAEKVIQQEAYRNSRRVAVYLAMKDEVETIDLISDIIKSGKTCFIPRYEMTSRHMDMVKLDSLEEIDRLPLTKWNIRQPAASDGRENALDSGGLDLILLPGLAFTADGRRLGRGKGYYDTFLSRHLSQCGRSPVTMALAYHEQVVEDVPTDDHDYTLEHVISD